MSVVPGKSVANFSGTRPQLQLQQNLLRQYPSLEAFVMWLFVISGMQLSNIFRHIEI